MKTGYIFDIVESILTIPFVIYYIYVMNFVRINKELEFNRMWRTRMFLVFCGIAFSLLYTIGNYRIIGEKIDDDLGPTICTIFSFLEFSIFNNFFICGIMAIVKLATSLAALDTDSPNKIVFKKTLCFSIPGFLLGLAILIINIVVGNVYTLSSYDVVDDVCYTPSMMTTVNLVTVVVVLVAIAILRTQELYITLNHKHRKMITRLPFWMIFFLVGGAASEFLAYFNDTTRFSLELVVLLAYNGGFSVFVYLLILKPIRESLEVPLMRGTITQRHEKYIEIPV